MAPHLSHPLLRAACVAAGSVTGEAPLRRAFAAASLGKVRRVLAAGRKR